MRAVVHGLGPQQPAAEKEADTWHHLSSILTVLVVVHAVALAYWLYLLFASRERRKQQGKDKEEAPAWRTPKDIMREYQKQQLGKL
jgi:heme/copper-type cytochrome/quinol oxidase subunit 2